MPKPIHKTLSGNRTDIAGTEHIFHVTTSQDTDDSRQRKTLVVPVSEAAKLLGITERTVWRRLDRGELKSKLKSNKRLVSVPIFEPTSIVDDAGHTTVTNTPHNAHAVVDLNVLLHELQGANYRVGYLESENKKYEEQVKLPPISSSRQQSHRACQSSCRA